MLIASNNFVFVEKVDDPNLVEEKGIIYDTNLEREKIIRGRVFLESEDEYYFSNYPDGTEVLCDIVGAREFTYRGKVLHIITTDSIFGILKHSDEYMKNSKAGSSDFYGQEF